MTKPIQIRKDEVVRDIREAAALTRLTITDVVAEGVRLVLERERRANPPKRQSEAIDDAIARFQAAVKRGRMPTDDDFYDENGLPR